MKRREFLYTASAATLSLSLSRVSVSLANEQAPTIYTNGNIFTMNASNDMAEAIAIHKGKIIAVGKKADVVAKAGENAKVIDLKGKSLLPGFVDGHSHFPAGGTESLATAPLASPPIGKVKSIAELQEALAKKAAQTPEGELVRGTRYNDLAIEEQRHPTRKELDEVSTKHPILITHVSGHSSVGNSMLFEKIGITPSSKISPDLGTIPLVNGEILGVMEGAGITGMAIRKFPPIVVDSNDVIAYESNVYASAGITTANQGSATKAITDNLNKACAEDILKIRVAIWPNYKDEELIKSYGDLRQGAVLDDKGLLILGAIKLFADGSPQGYTAHFSKPYFKQMTGKPADYRGFSYFQSPEARTKKIQELHNAGWQMATHTNGDQAIEDMIVEYAAALKKNPRDDHRHILNHCQFNRADQVPRIAENNLIPSYFVTHTYFWGDIHREFVAGPELAAHISPCKQALDYGIPFALHNDTPVTPIDPLLDVYSAVTRLTSSGYVLGPDQRIGVMDALRGVTINAARMYFMEDKVGSLEVGKLADLVILSENPVTVDPTTIKDIEVLETIVGGNTVYKA